MSIDLEELKRDLKECQWMIGSMCAEGRPPKMSIPARPNHDEDIFICETIKRAVARLEAADHFINHVEGEAACFLGYGDDGVIGDDNVLRAVRIMHKRKIAADNFYRRIKEISESGDCGKMLEDALAAFDKEQQ